MDRRTHSRTPALTHSRKHASTQARKHPSTQARTHTHTHTLLEQVAAELLPVQNVHTWPADKSVRSSQEFSSLNTHNAVAWAIPTFGAAETEGDPCRSASTASSPASAAWAAAAEAACTRIPEGMRRVCGPEESSSLC